MQRTRSIRAAPFGPSGSSPGLPQTTPASSKGGLQSNDAQKSRVTAQAGPAASDTPILDAADGIGLPQGSSADVAAAASALNTSTQDMGEMGGIYSMINALIHGSGAHTEGSATPDSTRVGPRRRR